MLAPVISHVIILTHWNEFASTHVLSPSYFFIFHFLIFLLYPGLGEFFLGISIMLFCFSVIR